MRVLVDTCVIIDALQSRVPFAEAAQKLFIYSANMQFEGYITAKSITDIYYLTHRLTHSDAETRKILSKLFTLFHLLDTTSLDCRKAISSEIGDYEDAIMVETAIRSEMDCIVTRNVKDYAKSSVKVCEPSALIKLLEEEKVAVVPGTAFGDCGAHLCKRHQYLWIHPSFSECLPCNHRQAGVCLLHEFWRCEFE